MRGPRWSRSSSTPGRNHIPMSPFPCAKLPKHTPPAGAPGLQPGLPFSRCVQSTFHPHCLSWSPPQLGRLPSPLRTLQNPPTTFPGRNTVEHRPRRAQALDRARPSRQPRRPGKVGDAQSLLGDRGPPRALPQRGLHGGRRVRATGGSPASRAVPTRSRQLGKTDGPSPARAVEQGGSCHWELHNPGLERAIKCSGARHGIRAIFPSRGRSRTFFLGGGGGGREEKREKKEKRTSTALAPLPSVFWSPGTARRHPGLPEVASCPAYIVTCSVSPGLCPPLARQSPLSGPLPAYLPNGSIGPRPLREAPSSSVFYKPGFIKGRDGVPVESLKN